MGLTDRLNAALQTISGRQQTLDEPPQEPAVVGPGQIHRFFGLQMDELSSQQVKRAYRSVVATLQRFRAKEIAAALKEVKAVRREDQEESEQLEIEHPWVQLLNRPCRFMPATIFWQYCSQLIDSQGHVDLAVEYESDMGRLVPRGLLIVFPAFGHITPVTAETGATGAWHFQRTGGGSMTLPRRSIIRLKEPHPVAPWLTAGKIEAAAYEIDEQAAQDIFGRDKARSMGRPNVVLKDTESKTETEQEAKRIGRQFSKMYHQQTDLTPVERGGFEIEAMDITASDMQFLESRRLTIDRLFMIYEMPKGMLTSEAGATGKGREGAKEQWEENTLQPEVDTRTEQLEYHFRRVFEAEDSDLGLQSPNVKTVSPEEQLKRDRMRLETGTPVNRVLRERGEEEVDNGDTALVSGSLQSLDTVSAGLA